MLNDSHCASSIFSTHGSFGLVWLNFFHAELPPKSRYWQGQKFQDWEVGREIVALQSHQQNDSCIKICSDEGHFILNHSLLKRKGN